MTVFTDNNKTPLIRRIPGSIDSVGAGKTMVIRVPPGSTYGGLMLAPAIGGAAPTRVQLEAMLGEVQILMGGVTVETLNMKQIIAVAEFYNPGIVGDTGFVPFDFEQLFMEGILAQNGPAWGTLGESSFEIQIQQAAGSTIDTCELVAEVEPKATELGVYMKRFRVSPAIIGLGPTALGNLPRPENARLYAIHIECSVPANLTHVRFAADDIDIIGTMPVAMLYRWYQRPKAKRTPQTTIRTGAFGQTAGFVHIDFRHRGYDDDAMRSDFAVHNLELTYANAVPTVHNIIMEYALIQASRRK